MSDDDDVIFVSSSKPNDAQSADKPSVSSSSVRRRRNADDEDSSPAVKKVHVGLPTLLQPVPNNHLSQTPVSIRQSNDALDLSSPGSMQSLETSSSVKLEGEDAAGRSISTDNANSLCHLWFWAADNGDMQPFDTHYSDIIEKAFNEKTLTSFMMKIHANLYFVDLINLLQTNMASRKQRRIQRICLGTARATADWYVKLDCGLYQLYSYVNYGISSDEIETAFCSNFTGSVQRSIHGMPHAIDFVSMTQKNLQTGVEQKVRRVTIGSDLTENGEANQTNDHKWYWRADDDTWKLYDSSCSNADSRSIEQMYSARKYCPSMRIERASSKCEINFFQMIELDIETRKWRNVRRVSDEIGRKSAFSLQATIPASVTLTFPNTWLSENFVDRVSPFQLVPITNGGSTMNEYKEISDLFYRTMPNVKLRSIERVQNRNLWVSFCVQKMQLESRLGPGNGIRRLFHGTSRKYVDAICLQGFDWRLNGTSSGTVYGKGSYFARDAQYSTGYTDCKTMFVALVLVGDYTLGNSSTVRPPPKNRSNPTGQLYDSCVDDPSDPTIFVTFNSAHSYPEYLLKF